MMQVDMHVHTRASHDCLSDPERVVAVAAQRGIDRICITDHNEIGAALELKAKHGARVIVGEEVKTAEGVDVIGLFMRERIPKGTPARDTCARIRAQGGIVYIPHPFARGKGGRGRLLPELEGAIDIIEGFNARLHEPVLNERAERYARNAGLPVGAGSDAHTLREIGRAYVRVPDFDDDPAAFLDAVRRGSTHGKASSRLVHLASTWAKLRGRSETERSG